MTAAATSVDAAAAQDDVDEPVVRAGGPLDRAVCARSSRLAADSSSSAARVSSSSRALSSAMAACAASEPSSATSDAVEGARGPVGGVQHADDLGARAISGTPRMATRPSSRDAAVDLLGVPEAGVGEVAGGGVRRGGLGDQAAEPGAHRQPERLEARGDRAVGDPHVGVAAAVVVERQVGDVGAEQLPGPPDDRGEHRVDPAQRGEVAGGVEQRGQLRLPPPAGRERLADLQGEQLEPARARRARRRPRPAARARTQRPLVLDRRGVLEQQVEVLAAAATAAGPRPVRQRRVTPGILAVGTQCALQPPSITSELPVTEVAAGEHRQATRLGDLVGLDQPLDRRRREHDLLDDLVLADAVGAGLVGDLALDQRGAHVGGVDAVAR